MARRPLSLVTRLALWAVGLFAVSLPVFWGLFTVAIDGISRDVVDTRIVEFGSQLRGYWASATAAGNADDSSIGDFGTSDVGWVWQITVDHGTSYRSTLLRLADAEIETTVAEPRPDFTLRTANTGFGRLRIAERVVAEVPPGGTGPVVAVHYLAAIPVDRYDAYVAEHAARLQGLTLLVALPVSLALLALFAAMILSIRRDLSRMGTAMRRFEAGETERIDGRFPRELQSLADRMNALLTHNARLIDRTRKYVTKIAHDMNHPLAVLKNGLDGEADPDLMKRQVARMTGLIDRYSSLARAIGPEGQARGRTGIAEVLADVRDGFSIVYRRTPLAIELDCDPALSFPVPRHDLEAMVSNLVSNAHKYAESRVSLQARSEGGGLRITVDDDGPGIPAAAREAAFNWGKRLDEAPPGTGFGLSIVRDIAVLYEGTVTLAESPLGGLRVEITLPSPHDTPAPR
ncbi:MAG: HAMP domain-containing histidine kinase [Hyphomicrobiales bacterium]|nr:HAMP domain-containing histidine kinase [Hyphomicrobiales bacterium]MCP5370737.1 HAMP domain-containing histidine kinase [Hyphomicrobiales bacterium]